jgi:AcrR family transcriptional regulator
MPSRRQEQKAATRQRIYDTAESAFLADGYDATSVSKITGEAGVAKGTFFVHFPSKADLLAEMGEQHLRQALDVVEGAERMSSWPFSRQVDHVFRTMARGVDQNAELMKMVVANRAFAEAGRPSPAQDRLRSLLTDLVKEGKRSNELRADVLADRMALHLFGIWKMSLEQWSERGGNFERWLMESVRLTFDGLSRG